MSKRKYRVLWTEIAARDLADIALYVAYDSPASARLIVDKMRERTAALEHNPLRGRVVPELARLGLRSWREIVIKPYRLVYRVEAQTVIVLAVFDSRRNLEDILLDRMVR